MQVSVFQPLMQESTENEMEWMLSNGQSYQARLSPATCYVQFEICFLEEKSPTMICCTAWSENILKSCQLEHLDCRRNSSLYLKLV